MRGTGTVEARVAGAATASAVVTVYALPETGLVATMLGSLGVDTDAGPPVTATDWTSQWSLSPVASQAAKASQPEYDGATLDFDGTDDYMTFAEGLTDSTASTVLVLARYDANGAYGWMLDNGTSAPNRLSFGVENSTPAKLCWNEGSGIKGGSEVFGVGYRLVGLLLDGDSAGYIRKDRAQVDMASSAGTKHWSLAAAVIGARWDTTLSYWTGPIAAMVVYSRMLSGDDLTYAEEFLTAYGQSLGVLS
jgi:hypothetical protein